MNLKRLRTGEEKVFCRLAESSCLLPKRRRAGALQDASRDSPAAQFRASVLECGGPPPLFPANIINLRIPPRAPKIIQNNLSTFAIGGHIPLDERRVSIPGLDGFGLGFRRLRGFQQGMRRGGPVDFYPQNNPTDSSNNPADAGRNYFPARHNRRHRSHHFRPGQNKPMDGRRSCFGLRHNPIDVCENDFGHCHQPTNVRNETMKT